MDSVALQTLRDEMLDDCRMMQEAFQKALLRFDRREEVDCAITLVDPPACRVSDRIPGQQPLDRETSACPPGERSSYPVWRLDF
jgi:hypothetical protein